MLGRQDLRAKVEAWWVTEGWGIPPFHVTTELPGFLVRNIATARYEDCLFALMAERAGFTPVWGQFVRDIHSMRSSVKKSYLVGEFCSGRGKRGGPKTDRHEFLRVANGRPGPKRTLHLVHERWVDREIRLITEERTGESLVARHNGYQRRILGVEDDRRIEFSAWLRQERGGKVDKSQAYYPRYLSMFVAHAVLFEDYHGGESGTELDGFTATVFEPAFKQVTERFGVSPIIVPLPWWPELAFYPHPDAGDWRTHGIIPPEYF
ncbi:MAG: hypothetical protein AAB483_01030 [Patescibacteria group bacterium]